MPTARQAKAGSETKNETGADGSIYAVLRADIATMRLRPGARLSENELAARFGTSRAPVREALIRLVEDGLIEVRPQRGSFVSPISLQAMEQGRLVREALEVAIVRRACEQKLSSEAIARCETAISQQVASKRDPERFTYYDDMFHRAFAEATSLNGVWAIIEREKVQFDRLRILSLPEVTPVNLLITQHRDILAAVARGNADKAEKAIRAHLSEVLRITDDLALKHPEIIVANR
jgi:GntR family transcriptional regulator, rspAB operon transcriptional repressor